MSLALEEQDVLPMSHEEQLEWLRQEDPAALGRKFIEAVTEYPTSDDIWFLVMDILNM